MEISEKGYEIVTEALNDVLNKAVTGIQTESAVSSLFEIKALAHFALKVLRSESFVSSKKKDMPEALMIPALKYPRFPVYRTSRLEGTTFIETAACYVPDFSYQYHAFLIIDGREVKKKYRKSLAGAKRVCRKMLQDACLARDDL